MTENLTIPGEAPGGASRWPVLRGPARSASLWLSGVVVGLCVWYGLAHVVGVELFPPPQQVFVGIAQNFLSSSYLAAHSVPGASYGVQLWYTTENVLIAVAGGTLIGVSLGMAAFQLRPLSQAINPVFVAVGTVPIFVVAPFFVIWFGIVPQAQILMVGFYTTLLMYFFARQAASNMSIGYVESALSLGASRWARFWGVYLPGSVPELVGGLRIALAGAWGLEAVAELLGSERGIGFVVKFYSSAYNVEGMLELTVLLGFVAVACDRLAVALSRPLVAWTDTGTRA